MKIMLVSVSILLCLLTIGVGHDYRCLETTEASSLFGASCDVDHTQEQHTWCGERCIVQDCSVKVACGYVERYAKSGGSQYDVPPEDARPCGSYTECGHYPVSGNACSGS